MCRWFKFLEPGPETIAMTHFPLGNTVCFFVYKNVLIFTFTAFV